MNPNRLKYLTSVCKTHIDTPLRSQKQGTILARILIGIFTLLALSLSRPMAQAQSYTLHTFTGNNGDGANPVAGLINVNGILYGTTENGGTHGYGTIFSVDPATGTEKILYSFDRTHISSDGAYPEADLINVNGVLYGTTVNGGNTAHGVVFSFNLNTNAEKSIYSFTNENGDGAYPEASLLNVNGILYGTTQYGGPHGYGTVFSLDLATGTEKTIHGYNPMNVSNDEGFPEAGLINVNGILYGTTKGGGDYYGTIFSINPDGTGYQTLYVFPGYPNAYPVGNLLNVNGTFYGITTYNEGYNSGTLFSFDPTTRSVKTLHTFGTITHDGSYPMASITEVNGILYGTTQEGGSGADNGFGYGTIFSINPDGTGYQILDNFTGAGDGHAPVSDLLNINGTLYGNTQIGGSYNLGSVFRLALTVTDPVAYNDAYSINYKTTSFNGSPSVLANDDPSGSGPLTATLVSPTTNGTLTFNTDGSFTYKPNAGFLGADTFTYQASTPFGTSNIATVTLNVVPTTPIAKNDECSVNLNTPRSNPAPGVLSNDDSGYNGPATATLVNTTTHGTLTLNSDGSFSYTPDTGYVGSDSFTYQISSPYLTGNTATVYLDVVPTAPIAHNDGCSVNYNTTRSNPAPGVLSNDDSLGEGALTAKLVSTTTHGTLTLNSDGSFTYTPNTGYVGTDTFTYQVRSSVAVGTTATVTLTVVPGLPTAKNDAFTGKYGTTTTFAAPGVLANDDDGGTSITATLVSTTSHGSLTLNSDGSFTYTPNAGFAGTDSFTYQAVNSVGSSNIATVTLTIPATLPFAHNDGATILHDTGRFFNTPGVLGNDDDGGAGPMTATLIHVTQHGTVSLGSDGSFIYVPINGFTGTDTFTYQVANSVGKGNIATVTLTVQ